MLSVFILTAHLSGGFSMLPFDSAFACQSALDSLSAAVVTGANCTRIEMVAPSSPLAPEMAPLPPRKPWRAAP